MTIKDINTIIEILCPNDEDYEKPIISPKYLRQELEQLALEQEPVIDKARAEIEKLQTYKMFIGEKTVYVERDDVLAIIDKHKGESGK